MLERIFAAVLAVGLVGAGPLAAAYAGEDTDEEEAPEQLAVLEVELTPGESATIKYPPQDLPWGGEATMVASVGEHKHTLEAKVERKENDAKVVLRYLRDGEKVFDKVELTVALGADATQPAGESKIRVKVSEKKPREKIEMPDGDDPLDGVL